MKKLNLISSAIVLTMFSSASIAASNYTFALSHYGSPSDTVTKATELMAKERMNYLMVALP